MKYLQLVKNYTTLSVQNCPKYKSPIVSFPNEFSPFFGRYLVTEEGVQAFLTYLNNCGFHTGWVVELIVTVLSLNRQPQYCVQIYCTLLLQKKSTNKISFFWPNQSTTQRILAGFIQLQNPIKIGKHKCFAKISTCSGHMSAWYFHI